LKPQERCLYFNGGYKRNFFSVVFNKLFNIGGLFGGFIRLVGGGFRGFVWFLVLVWNIFYGYFFLLLYAFVQIRNDFFGGNAVSYSY
jgi:hypothetical protein